MLQEIQKNINPNHFQLINLFSNFRRSRGPRISFSTFVASFSSLIMFLLIAPSINESPRLHHKENSRRRNAATRLCLNARHLRRLQLCRPGSCRKTPDRSPLQRLASSPVTLPLTAGADFRQIFPHDSTAAAALLSCRSFLFTSSHQACFLHF